MEKVHVSEEVRSVFESMNKLGASGTPYLFAVDYALQQGFILPHPLQQNDIFFQVGAISNGLPCPQEEERTYATEEMLQLHPISYSAYLRKYQRIEKALQRGDSFLANLTLKTPIITPFSLEQIYRRASAPYKLLLRDRFVCFSPERFVAISEGGKRIETCPMKGTIDASLPDAEEVIRNNYKETAEHYTIVDLMRNDLARIGTNVRVEEFRYIDRVATLRGELLQVSSRIVADLSDNALEHLGDIFQALLPAGSISGAPKQATLEAIHEAEQESRGYYTGVFGYFDGSSVDSGVLIRFIEKDEKGNTFFRSGGGITINSSPKEEYEEVIQKIYLPFH